MNEAKPLKISKILHEMKKELELNFNLFIEAHTNYVYSLAVTNDSKYLISGSGDATIRIWNLLEKRQVSLLRGHTSYV